MNVLLVLLIVLAMFVGTDSAKSETENDIYRLWIHANFKSKCCPHDNCHPVKATFTGNGWVVEGLSGMIPAEAVFPWPFPVVYACWYEGSSTVRCLFMGPVRM